MPLGNSPYTFDKLLKINTGEVEKNEDNGVTH